MDNPTSFDYPDEGEESNRAPLTSFRSNFAAGVRSSELFPEYVVDKDVVC